ncbi:hypothetical protein [Streptomyces sp. NPDC005538]|jgi:hypothetical protein
MAWTPKQQQGQNALNKRISDARKAPVQGKPVPDKAKRNGSMNT